MKDPAFLFYPGDFLVGVSDLTMEERGQYITLLCIQHAKGRLTEKNIQLSVGTVSPDVLAKFEKDEDGCYYNSRLEFEIVRRERFIASKVENGSKGGRPKKTTENPNETQTKPNKNLNETYSFNLAKANQNLVENENINENININKDVNVDRNDHITSLFNKFWERYPKKIAKEYAFKCFTKIVNIENIFNDILASVENHRRWRGWSDARYIPHPSTFLNQRRWEDELPDDELSSEDFDDFFQAALERSKYDRV